MQNLRFIAVLLLAGLASISNAQDKYLEVESFNKVELGQRIRAIFTPGDTESVRYELNGVHPDDLIIRGSGKKLEIYLEKAKSLEKQRKIYDNGYKQKVGWYEGSWVNVYITYKELKKVISKGEEDLDITGTINTDVFKLKTYGDLEIEIDDLTAEKLKAKLYGENDLDIKSGAIGLQKYKLYGDNRIETRDVRGELVKATNYGESVLRVNTETVKFTVFGEIDVECGHGTNVRKGIVLGDYSVTQW
jgi:hypothetical protein